MVALVPRRRAEYEHVVLDGVSWDLYVRLREEVHGRKRMTYDRGTLEIMAPSYPHEEIKKLVAQLIEAFTRQRRIPMKPAGATTFSSEILEKGLEPDECYYIQNFAAVQRRQPIDLRIHPPPDLAIEVDVTSWSIPRLPIYAALGVPEIWRFSDDHIEVLLLSGETYRTADTSIALPALRPHDLSPFIAMLNDCPDNNEIVRRFEAWVREIHTPPSE